MEKNILLNLGFFNGIDKAFQLKVRALLLKESGFGAVCKH
jgi:hypothetical protein